MDIAIILIIAGVFLFLFGMGRRHEKHPKNTGSSNWSTKEWQEYMKDVQKRLDDIDRQ